ncbi:OmpA family protein [Solidesulfovibrio sp. C21]|uniref:OmpA/MotB family protein n=1 Tax=Solidesulfovibrio sp. C21 TaxID=3398613 RepID=UPI0039FC9E22
MRGRLLKVLMVVLVLIPVGLTAYLANNLYHRKGVPEALENLTKQLFRSKADERKAEARAVELERKTNELQTAYDALVADLRGEVDSRDIRVRQFREKLEINFVDKILFASGSAEITPRGREILRKVGSVLAKVKDKSIYVVGHTDSNPIHSALYPSNWELSTARSASVIRFLSESGGVTSERFTAMGRAFYQPVASNATPEGRQENRRVDIIVADVPLLAGETGSESMRGTVNTGQPSEHDLTGQQSAPIRETAPQPAAQPTPLQTAPAAPEPAPATPETSAAPETPAAPEGAQPAEPSATAPQPAPAEQPAQPAKPEQPKPGSTATPPASPELPPTLPDRSGSGATGS